MSVGNAVGAVVGAVIGFYVGGPAGALKGAQLGMTLGGIVDPPKGPSINGPRLTDLTLQTSSYNSVIPRAYGTVSLTGNVFWLENNQLKEVATTNKSGGKGGGGSEVTTFSYYATFAVGLCKGPISGVCRIWVGPKLIYDAGSSDLSTIITSNSSATLFTLHTGSDTQLPDDRMQSTLGIANTPAYRGLAYLVFKDYPLANHGNSLMGAQVKVEIMTNMSVLNPQLAFTSAFNRSVNASICGVGCMGKNEDAVVLLRPEWTYGLEGGVGDCSVFNGNIDGSIKFNKVDSAYRAMQIINNKGPKYFGPITSITHTSLVQNGKSFMVYDFTIPIYQEEETVVFCRGYDLNYSRPAIIRVTNAGTKSIFSLPTIAAHFDVTEDSVVVIITGTTYILDKKTLDLVDTRANTLVVSNSYSISSYYDNGTIYICNETSISSIKKLNATFTQVIETIALPPPGRDSTLFSVSGNIIKIFSYVGSNYSYEIIKLNIISPSSKYLSAIVSSECLSSKLLTAGDIDVTALTQTVRGYRIGRITSLKTALEPLQATWPFDIIQSGYKIKFKPRGSASVVTIPEADLGSRQGE